MRPGQNNYNNRNNNNNRPRGRGRRPHSGGGGSGGGGGGGNPINRVYESNGPDVKVRGTAQTVAEKYLQLGRDAQSASDTVMAESYYQHAEHYFRIVAAAQAYQQQVQQQYRDQNSDDGGDDEGGDEGGDEAQEAAVERPRGAAPAPSEGEDQPDIMGYEPERPHGFPPAQNANQQNTQNRDQNREFRSRNNDNQGGGRYRNRFDRNRERAGEQGGGEARPRPEQDPADAPPAPAAAAPVEAQPQTWNEDSAPSFLRRPRTARPRRERSEESAPEQVVAEPQDNG